MNEDEIWIIRNLETEQFVSCNFSDIEQNIRNLKWLLNVKLSIEKVDLRPITIEKKLLLENDD